MSDKPLGLTRNQLGEFLPNQRAVRAFEQLLKNVGNLLPSDIATLNRLIQEAYIEAADGSAKGQSALDQLGGIVQDAAINAGAADNKATQALAALVRIAHAIELLSTAPAIRDDNSLSADYIDLRDNGWIPSYRLGRVWFGPTGTLEVAMGNGNITQQVGEEFFRYGKASSAISDTNLQLVYKTGVVGASGVITFAPAVAGITDPDQILGIATESIAINGFGRITTMGVVHGINTTGSVYGETWADNDDIWYNPVTGGLTKTKPSAPNVKVQVGTVINAGGGGSGSFSVKIGSSSSLGGTDSNVQFSSLASGNIIIYDAVAQYFKNAFLTAGTNVTITNGPGSITIAVTGAPPTGSAGGVLSGSYPNPGFAVDMATQAELDAHTGATGTAVHGLGTVSTLASDTDGTLAANSDTRIATQKAVKTYVDNAVVGLMDLKGNINCSTNPNYPAALKGDAYYVTAAGKIGGASGVSVDIGDVIVASADNAGGTQAAVGSSWFVLEHNLTGALLAANNLSDVANAATARSNLGAEAAITAGTTAQYWRGDKTWTDFATDVRAAILTGLSTATNAVITATDTVLSALGKLQKQISDNLTTLTTHTGASSGVHGATGSVVGTTDTQTLTNKTLDVLRAGTAGSYKFQAQTLSANPYYGTVAYLPADAGSNQQAYRMIGRNGGSDIVLTIEKSTTTQSYGGDPSALSYSELYRYDSAGVFSVASGVKFPATQVASSDANTLDDYEEGTWTPTVTAGSGAITSYNSTGSYTKVGRMVTVTCYIAITNNGTGASYLNVAGLPFTVGAQGASTGVRSAAALGTTNAVQVPNGGTSFTVWKYDNTYPVATNSTLNFSFSYFV